MSHRLELPAIDGSNPLGYLAALGTLATLSDSAALHGVRLSWHASGAWRPVLVHEERMDVEAVVSALASTLAAPGAARPFEIRASDGELFDDLTMNPVDYRRYAMGAAESSRADRRSSDFAAAFASDVVVGPKGQMADTAFRTMSGAGHQHLLESMRELVESTIPAHVRAALFEPWAYEDDPPTMRWDPEDDRRYALRWREPSGDKIRTVRGANRLAVEGLRFFPSMPVGRRLITTAFSGRGASDTFFRWPIWERPIPADVVRSLLAFTGLGPDSSGGALPRSALAALGVVEVFQSQRLTIGKYRNFSPGRPV